MLDVATQTRVAVVLSHGIGNTSFVNHENLPFTVSGILAPTGTPVDRTIHVSLQGIEAIHLGWQNGAQVATLGIEKEDPRLVDLQPTQSEVGLFPQCLLWSRGQESS